MTINEPQKRLEIVGAQHDIENAVADAARSAAAVFFVPTMLTPLYFRSGNVIFDEDTGLFSPDPFCFDANGVLSSEERLPEGLIPEAKAKDPRQLSTVCARVKSLEKMLLAGLPVTIITPNAGRPRVDNNNKEVVPATGSLLHRFRNQITVITISQDLYDANKDSIPAATYYWEANKPAKEAATKDFEPGCFIWEDEKAAHKWEDDKTFARSAAFFATQISAPNSSAKFDKLFDLDAALYVDNVNGMLMNLGQPTMFEMAAPDYERPNIFRKLDKSTLVPGVTG